MNVALRAPMTLAQFLAWEERQELCYEFDGFQPVAMTGGTSAHDAISMNIAIAMGPRLRGTPCRLRGSNLKIEVAGHICYPEAFVTCAPVDPRSTVVRDPVVIFEVRSESTANTDLIEKNAEYRATPSVQRYVILEQTHAAAFVFVRKGGDWVTEVLAGEGAVLALPEIGIALPLAELYADVTLAGDAVPDEGGAR